MSTLRRGHRRESYTVQGDRVNISDEANATLLSQGSGQVSQRPQLAYIEIEHSNSCTHFPPPRDPWTHGPQIIKMDENIGMFVRYFRPPRDGLIDHPDQIGDRVYAQRYLGCPKPPFRVFVCFVEKVDTSAGNIEEGQSREGRITAGRKEIGEDRKREGEGTQIIKFELKPEDLGEQVICLQQWCCIGISWADLD